MTKHICLIGMHYAVIARMDDREIEKLRAYVDLTNDLELLTTEKVLHITCEELLEQWSDSGE